MLSRLKRVPLVSGPTPLEVLPRMGRTINRELYIKRDDLTGLGGGGNKARKLEYLVQAALDEGADWLVTTGAVQSNHAQATAAAARKFGLNCWLVLEGEPGPPTGNLLLNHIYGARITYCPKGEAQTVLEQTGEQLRREGATPYLIPVGGSTPLGAIGFVRGMWELSGQMHHRDTDTFTIYCATGSAGTQAGLVLGAHLFCPGVDVIGISVNRNRTEAEQMVFHLVERASELLGVAPPPRQRVVVDDGFVGPGYAVPTEEANAALLLAARTEGLLLDPVYTAKAMAGLLELGPQRSGRLLFWHTGGMLSLSAHPELAGLGA